MNLNSFIPGALLLTGAFFIAILPASAQSNGGNFVMSANVIAAGGGVSTGGDFTLNGTVGQHDTGVATGGNFALEGGFWHGIQLLQLPFSPTLKIKCVTGPRAVISWPVGEQGWTLEEADSPAGPVWTPVAAVVMDTLSEHTVTVPAAGNIKCYRLRKTLPPTP